MSFPDKDARKSLDVHSQRHTSHEETDSKPNISFALQHLFSLSNTLALQIYLFKQESIDLFKLHSVFLPKFLDLFL